MKHSLIVKALAITCACTLFTTSSISTFAEESTVAAETQSAESTQAAESVQPAESEPAQESVQPESEPASVSTTTTNSSETTTTTAVNTDTSAVNTETATTETTTETETVTTTEAVDNKPVKASESDMASEYVDQIKGKLSNTEKLLQTMDLTAPDGTAFPADITFDANVTNGMDIMLYHFTNDSWETISPKDVSDGSITATFNSLSPVAVVEENVEPEKFTITYKTSDGGSIDNSEDIISDVKDAKGATAKASEGYKFKGWYDDDKLITEDVKIIPELKTITYTAKFVNTELTQIVGKYKITATADEFPDGAVLSVKESEDEKEVVKAVNDTLSNDTINIEETHSKKDQKTTAIYKPDKTFDIKILVNNEEWQPVDENKKVNIAITGVDDVEKDDNTELAVYRVTDDKTVTNMDAVKDDNNAVTFDTDHFTDYTVGGVTYTVSDTWYEDYMYGTRTNKDDSHTITLGNYKGSATQIYVPATAIINGVSYSVEISASYENCSKITDVVFAPGVDVYYARDLFMGCTSLKNVDINSANWSKCDTMCQMFYGCTSLTSLDVSGIDCSGVKGPSASGSSDGTSMIFGYCPNLEKITLGSKFKFVASSGMGCANDIPGPQDPTNDNHIDKYAKYNGYNAWVTGSNDNHDNAVVATDFATTFNANPVTQTYYAEYSTYSYEVVYDNNETTASAAFVNSYLDLPTLSGTVPTDSNSYKDGNRVSVLGNTGSLKLVGNTSGKTEVFRGWSFVKSPTESDRKYYAPYTIDISDAPYTVRKNNTYGPEVREIRLYAIYGAPLHVTYVSSGEISGTVPVDSTDYNVGDTITILGNTGNLKYSGKDFTNWSDAQDAIDDKGSTYNVGDSFAIDENITLYANTTMHKYEICYCTNTADAGEPPMDSNLYGLYEQATILDNVGNSLGLPDSTVPLSKTGYEFTGWNTMANGTGKAYKAGDTLRPRTLYITGTNCNITVNNDTYGTNKIMLYAQWKSTSTSFPITITVRDHNDVYGKRPDVSTLTVGLEYCDYTGSQKSYSPIDGDITLTRQSDGITYTGTANISKSLTYDSLGEVIKGKKTVFPYLKATGGIVDFESAGYYITGIVNQCVEDTSLIHYSMKKNGFFGSIMYSNGYKLTLPALPTNAKFTNCEYTADIPYKVDIDPCYSDVYTDLGYMLADWTSYGEGIQALGGCDGLDVHIDPKGVTLNGVTYDANKDLTVDGYVTGGAYNKPHIQTLETGEHKIFNDKIALDIQVPDRSAYTGTVKITWYQNTPSVLDPDFN